MGDSPGSSVGAPGLLGNAPAAGHGGPDRHVLIEASDERWGTP
ncbi:MULTISPECIES: hypothetical protein [Nocardiopsidaceae]|uniref:Uncharacterized protein n=1 Tax=Streptomonospora nanhaiensis TaxID=1323731 RepID=A0ABY6YTZ3_9ACTN|nr:hypothetical protein [Streptomonospora nanhaiensis]WAE75872.1 hypothetical protein OUQ99_12685 [Streptomonospora nanhaiensis]